MAVNVITPNPKNAKKVSATLEITLLAAGYPEGASRWGWRLTSVETANTARLPTTTTTTTVCALATARDPNALSSVIAPISRTAKTLTHVVLLPATAALE